MKANHRTERFLTLELNETEVDWLIKELIIKPEPRDQSKIRTQFLDALNPPKDAPYHDTIGEKPHD